MAPRLTKQGISLVLWLKGCPRCRGDLYETSDRYGRFILCLQCGHYLESDYLSTIDGAGRMINTQFSATQPKEKSGAALASPGRETNAGSLE